MKYHNCAASELSADEKLVRDTWKRIMDGGAYDDCPAIVVLIGPDGMPIAKFERDTFDECYSAAAEFTRKRLEQIRLVEEEIGALEYHRTSLRLAGTAYSTECLNRLDIFERILIAEKQRLADLRKGMKEQGNG